MKAHYNELEGTDGGKNEKENSEMRDCVIVSGKYETLSNWR